MAPTWLSRLERIKPSFTALAAPANPPSRGAIARLTEPVRLCVDDP